MKVCEGCGDEIATKDGEGKCKTCEGKRTSAAAARRRRANDQALRDIGMTKVRGAMGGTYWE